jgi:hypothetical protein
MLTFRDVVIVGALVALVMWWFKRRCGCAQRRPMSAEPGRPAPPPRAPSSSPRPRGCSGLAPCGGAR